MRENLQPVLARLLAIWRAVGVDLDEHPLRAPGDVDVRVDPGFYP